MVKFIAEALYFLLFVFLLIAQSFLERPSEGYKLSEHATIGPLYLWYNSTTSDPEVGNIYVRLHHLHPVTAIGLVVTLGKTLH